MKKWILPLLFVMLLSSPSFAQSIDGGPIGGISEVPIRASSCTGYISSGKFCYNTTTDKLYIGNGTSTIEVASTSNSAILSSIHTFTDANWDDNDIAWTMTGTGPLVHVTGNTTSVTATTSEAIVAGTTYKVTITGTGGGDTASYTLGAVAGTMIAASGTIAITDWITASTSGALIITPASTCTVSISSVTVQKLVAATGDLTVDGNLTVHSPATFDDSITSRDLITKGPWVDSRAYATIQLADAAALAAGKMLVVTQNYTLTANTVMTSKVMVIPGGSFTYASTYTLTFNNSFSNPQNVNCFIGFASGKVVFGSGSFIELYPQWWGAPVNGTNTDHTAINLALGSLPTFTGQDDDDFVHAYGGKLKLSPGTWYVTSPIILKNHHWLDGSGLNTTITNGTDSTAAINIGDGSDYVHNVRVTNLLIRGSGTPSYVSGGYGIYAQRLLRSHISNCKIFGTTDSGIRLKGSGYTYIENNYIGYTQNYGIEASHLEGGATFWQTSTTIARNTIRANKYAGIILRGSYQCNIFNNTIEANGQTATKIGTPSGAKQTTGTYSREIDLVGTVQCSIDNNYFEGFGIAMAGGYQNTISNNKFIGKGVYIWTGSDGTPTLNHIIQNYFPTNAAANFETDHFLGEARPSGNWILENFGIRWVDGATNGDPNYTQNTVNTAGSVDGLTRSIQAYTHVSGGNYSPDFGSYSGADAGAGRRMGTIIEITLQSNIYITTPISKVDGSVVYLRFIQDGTGGRTVTFDPTYFVSSFSNTGNIASTQSTVAFYANNTIGPGFWQIGMQTPWGGILPINLGGTGSSEGLRPEINAKSISQTVNMTAGSSSTGIKRLHDSIFAVTTGNFSIGGTFALPSWTPAANQFLIQKLTGGAGYQLDVVATSGAFMLILNATTYTSTVPGGGAASNLVAGTTHHIMAMVTVAATTTVSFSLDGILLSTPAAQANVDLTNSADLYILGTSAVRYAGRVFNIYPFNRALSAAEVLDLYRNGVDESDKWGSQTAVSSDTVWTGASGTTRPTGWSLYGAADATFDIVDSGDGSPYNVCLKMAEGASNSGGAMYKSITTVAGKRYRLIFYYKNINAIYGGYAITFGTPDGGLWETFTETSWTKKVVEFTSTNADTRIRLAIGASASGKNMLYDEFSLVEIGATLALEPEGIQASGWYDSSTNALNATYPTTGSSLTRKQMLFTKGADIASASPNLALATGNVIDITGTTTMTGAALGTVTAGTVFYVRFTGILGLTYNATSNIMPTGASITTAAGDTATLISLGSSNWLWSDYMRADGTALAGSGGNVATDAIWDAAGDLAQGTGANTAAKLTMGSEGQILRAGASSLAYTTATYPATITTGQVMYGSATNVVSPLALGTSGQVLQAGASTLGYSTVTYPATATTGGLLHGSATNVFTQLGEGSSGQYLKSGGAGVAPSWDTPGGAGDITSVGSCASGACDGTTLTWGDGTGPVVWTFSVTGTDPTMTVTADEIVFNKQIEATGFEATRTNNPQTSTLYEATSDGNSYGQFTAPALGVGLTGNRVYTIPDHSMTLDNITTSTTTNLTGLLSGAAGNVAAVTTSAGLIAILSDETGTGAAVFANTPTLVTPVIGVATGTSLMVTGRVDGTTGMLISTAASPTTIVVATHGNASYFMNIGNSAANSIFTLPTAAAGLQYCAKNYTGITTVLKFQTSASGQYIDLDGVLTATGGLIKSAGAAGDGACVVGVDATHWVAYPNKGTWTKD